MKRIFLIAALFAMPALTAQADITTDQLVTSYQAKGYERIEVTKGLTQIKVEAIKDGQKVEVIYDLVTGEILKSETGVAEAGDDIRPGVEVRNRNRDFLKGKDDGDDDEGEGDDDNSGDDSGDDSDDSDDDSGDDHGGDDDDSGDNDDGDDHGGDDDGDDD